MVNRAPRRGSRLGKYKLLQRLGRGGFAVVYRARDTVEGRDVALKLPHVALANERRDELLREVRITVRLEHPSILPILNADFEGAQLMIAYPLGNESLADRMRRRMATERTLGYAEQILDAVAYAHERRVIHCDINPTNVILFDDDRAQLADFGIARIAAQTRMSASGSGTVGYIAPEQAMGHPSLRSDVFSLGILFYQMFSGELWRWPYRWPPPGIQRARRKLTPEAINLLRRAALPDERRRFRDAVQMRDRLYALPEILR